MHGSASAAAQARLTKVAELEPPIHSSAALSDSLSCHIL